MSCYHTTLSSLMYFIIVMSSFRLEWLRLKQEYQKLQREAMKEVKMNLKKSQSPPPIRTEKTSKKAPDLSRNNASVEGTGLADGGMELPTKLEMQRGVVLKYFAEENIDKKNLRVCT